ncbi:MAG: hypothetical protein QOE52_3510, partial [Mycobacterium sp.]|nr:hypothetical protein [Mycobacterium sp.]
MLLKIRTQASKRVAIALARRESSTICPLIAQLVPVSLGG